MDKYLALTDYELIEALKAYARYHDGDDTAALCYAASIRIAVLTARLNTIDKDNELHG